MVSGIVNDIQKMLDVNTPIIFINDFDFVRVDVILKEALGSNKIFEWNPATKSTNFFTKESYSLEKSLESFLLEKYQDEFFKGERFLILREIQDYIENAEIKTLLQLIAQRRLYDPDYTTTIIIVSSVDRIPSEVKKYVSYIDLDYPSDEEIDELITEHLEINQYTNFNEDDRDQLRLSLRGMSKYDIDRVLDMAMSSNGSLGSDDTALILKQKKQMVKKSGILDLVDTVETIASIGGIDALKQYLVRKASVFKNWSKAERFGVTMPKGILIVGMPGCGKSLCAKAAANIFNIPLLKLDMGSMMGKYVGQSEENLRNSIKIAEAAAPCILWIDEIEKAFAGLGNDNDVLARMFGYFLSWMQDKKSNVYVIATANNADKLPPELKRKGRFDEIFCVNLPSLNERADIFKVHIDKLKNKECMQGIDGIDYTALAHATEGFNGADIESVVMETVENCFLREQWRRLDNASLLKQAKNTLCISKSSARQIDNMKKAFTENCFRDATTGNLSR